MELIVVAAIIQWRRRLSACLSAHGGHFEHIIAGVKNTGGA